MSDDGNRRAAPKGLSVALIVSLCLNCLVIGALAMMFWRWPYPLPPRGPGIAGAPAMEQGMGRGHGHGGMGLGQGLLNPHILARVAPAKSDAIKAVLESHRARLGALRDAAIAARREAALAMGDEHYSAPALDTALQAVLAADAALEAEVLKTVSECAGLLSPEERRAALRFRARGHGDGPGGGHGGGPSRWRP